MRIVKGSVLLFFLFVAGLTQAQTDTLNTEDSLINKIQEVQKLFQASKQQNYKDSIKKETLKRSYDSLRQFEGGKKEALVNEYKEIETEDSLRKAQMLLEIGSLKSSTKGFPVLFESDTLFLFFTRFGAETAQDRAAHTTEKLKEIYNAFTFNPDSLLTVDATNSTDIVYKGNIVSSISEIDALWHYQSKSVLAQEYVAIIKEVIAKKRSANSVIKLLVRIGLVILVVGGIWFLIRMIEKLKLKGELYIEQTKDKWIKDLSYKGYTFLTAEQELNLVHFSIKVLKWFLVLLLLYLLLPIVFSIFPFTQGWASYLFGLVWSPFKGVFVAIWKYLPNLISILVIVFVFRHGIRFVKYIFHEIKIDKLKISGFHSDWAMPTFSIVRFLLLAFMLVLIFPYLPGSESNIFKGVSVFLGILFSLGSSTAIANMVAGLVITYMRPFKIGDRIKVGQMTGDVVEKTMLVTRLRTVKNEEITIPNASILSGNTINYTTNATKEGLILHVTVTIGYDVPWKLVHKILLEAAKRTEWIVEKPESFVFQTSLDDFYVSYELNAFTKEASKQGKIYSDLNQNIQDCFNENKVEIMSPHYQANRNGEEPTITES